MNNIEDITDSYKDLLFESLKDSEYAEGYINAVLEEGDEAALLLALRNVVEARGGQTSDLTRIQLESLSHLLADTNDPHFSKLVQILDTLGLQLVVRSKVA